MKHHLIILSAAAVLLASCGSEKETESDQTTTTAPTITNTKTDVRVTSDNRPLHAVTEVYGIDISKYQGDIVQDLPSIDSLSFVICKATEGDTYTDPDFYKNWKMIKDKHMVRGAYHFYHTSDDPVKQAQSFVNTISGLEITDLPPVVDIEAGSVSGSPDMKQVQKDLITFLNFVAEHTNRKPMIYTGLSFANQYLNHPELADYPLWIAEYSDIETPALPRLWHQSGYAIWQRSQSYKIDSDNSDFDMFDGNGQAFSAFIASH